jgi:adenylate cyclase
MQGERVERRLAAILAADVAGYSRLMGRDEAGTLARLKSLRHEPIDPEIAAHKGRLVKTTGDGLLIEFPSVVEAVACAVAVQRAMAERNADIAAAERIEFRVGINLGDIILDEGDIHGDGVNVAARLEALAEPGGICVSAIVYEQVRDRLDLAFEDRGEQNLKNIARPLRPDKPSVAVLPFANMSSDPEQEFLADGLAEDIITALSRFPSLFVMARNSSFTYKGRAVDVKTVGRELGVRYVLEGSLRKAGSRIRVTAQLVEAGTGNHVWAERYDRDLADIFALQDEIAEKVTIAVAPAVAEAELHRAIRKPPQNLDAWAAYQRGLWHHGKFGAEDNRLARQFFQQAIDRDPSFAGGYRGLALAVILAHAFATPDLAEAAGSAERLARRAVALDPANAEARTALSTAFWFRGDFEEALREAERAVALAPSLALAHWAKGRVLIFSGRPREGLAAIETGFRLDPRNPFRANPLLNAAEGHYSCRDYEAAAEAARQAVRASPDWPIPYRWLAAALGQLGRAEEAKVALEKAMSIVPASFDRYVQDGLPFQRPEDHAHILDGLRKAGWQG